MPRRETVQLTTEQVDRVLFLKQLEAEALSLTYRLEAERLKATRLGIYSRADRCEEIADRIPSRLSRFTVARTKLERFGDENYDFKNFR